MFINILDKKRIEILPKLKEFKKDFYLAGGTGLAFQLGHRDSIDFDLFCNKDLDNIKLFTKIQEVFKGYKIVKTQDEKNTLSITIDDNIKISFLSYKYKLVDKLIENEYFKIASILDIACMKLSAVLGRTTNKDYIDLYFILQKISLKEVLEKLKIKMPELSRGLVLKSLVYFKDIRREKIKFKNNNNITFKMVQEFLVKEVDKIND
ncbi:MAG TPA: nucleotidyl transferase AbiEii/AbiGii toxin family protein [Candidatus Paceibacterota bacterium]|nr:nucleotidyl transferase AbiEii/AbiGii toxin family protein [Candidatus Paceibacterota bacterium]HRZ29758.1 nucleotidyl transferase AbiEii/AbiGii toxin family protein [Candidatus Paceibacterota bacterium]